MGVCYLSCFVLTECSCQHGDSIEPFYSSPLNHQPADPLSSGGRSFPFLSLRVTDVNHPIDHN